MKKAKVSTPKTTKPQLSNVEILTALEAKLHKVVKEKREIDDILEKSFLFGRSISSMSKRDILSSLIHYTAIANSLTAVKTKEIKQAAAVLEIELDAYGKVVDTLNKYIIARSKVVPLSKEATDILHALAIQREIVAEEGKLNQRNNALGIIMDVTTEPVK